MCLLEITHLLQKTKAFLKIFVLQNQKYGVLTLVLFNSLNVTSLLFLTACI